MEALTTASTTFGPAEWAFFIAHLALIGAGIYVGFVLRATFALARQRLRLLGYGLIALGALGALIAATRLGGVALPGLLFTTVTLLDVLLAVFAVYYALRIYPQQRAAAVPQRGRIGRASQAAPVVRRSNGATATAAVQPEAADGSGSGRRDARRSQKRRKR
ncbi:MAG TPA: hypothetical protein PKA05_15530 [Roseiflexaceae bacterium]|nr:hypothetical protein [Roseiflexaceae bacterium]